MSPDRSADPDHLREDAAAKRQRAGDVVGRTSAVPLALFSPCDPMVEAKLVDDAIELLRHMNVHEGPRTAEFEPPAELPENEITPAHMRALLGRLPDIERATLPDLDECRDQERLWILADIAMLGTGRAAARATELLGEGLADLWSSDGVDAATLASLAQMLREADARPKASQVFRAIRDAAEDVLDQKHRPPPEEAS
jgi:hypothetical protein